MDNLYRTASSSSSFDAFESKKFLQSVPTKPSPSDPTAHEPWSSKTPEKPINPPRRLRNRGAALSIKDIRQCAKKLQIQNPPTQSDPVTSPKRPPLTKSHTSLGSNKLPEKYEILDKFFSSLDSSIRLLRIKGTMSTFTNISPKMECLTDRRFTYGHLAQLKYILPEAIEVEKILVLDERTSCMKPDLHVTMDVNAIGDDVKVKANSGNLVLRKVFRARLVDFSEAHPEGDEIPEETLPEPFIQSKQELLDTNTTGTSKVSLTNTESVCSQQQPAAASHLSQSFTRKFSKKVSAPSVVPVRTPNLQVPETCFDQFLSGEEITESGNLCLTSTTKQKGLAPEEFPARPPTSRLPATPVKIFGLAKNESSSMDFSGFQGGPKSILTPEKPTSTPAKSSSTPAKSISTPAKPISTPKTDTPALQTPERCYMSQDDDLNKSPNKLVRRPQCSRYLKFDTPVKNEQVQEINKSGNLLMDNDIFDLLPESLLLLIREKGKKTLEDQDPAISQARRRQQIITGLPKLFDTLHFFFQSIKRSIVTKDELMHKIIASQLDIVDRRELEEQLRLLLELVPEWIYEKSACTGNRLLCINKMSSPESLRARLAEAI